MINQSSIFISLLTLSPGHASALNENQGQMKYLGTTIGPAMASIRVAFTTKMTEAA
jgi:hypothetical protein